MVCAGFTGRYTRVETLWLSGENRLTLWLSPFSIQGYSLEDDQKRRNYASCLIESMRQKEPQLKMTQELSLDFYCMLKAKNKSQLNQFLFDVRQGGAR
ncbi:hypothetical protein EGO53_28100 (plasmid) [Serratia liquefaciens]|uniref:Uncharacterized protein n=1 Tax=Serratia liquefaciens TaxID=614 RepID=A0A515D5I8_SERLI|nr:hypothetical protein EGO53_28100 [Serratia liquefaciens]